MTTSVKKQAARIAGKAIRQASEESRATVSGKTEFFKRFEESNLARETEGRDAFHALRRLRGRKLPHGDEVIIARHLYDELPVLKRHLREKGMGIGEFCSRCGITDASESSKELHRLTLPPSKNPATVRLRRAAEKYRSLVEAISKITNESVSTLADRVLRGTSLHLSKQMGSLSETEKLGAALQSIVDRVDSDFSIYVKFMEIAELKANHIAMGGTENWPLWQVTSDCQSPEEYNRKLADAADKRFAFWKRPLFAPGSPEAEYNPHWYPRADDSGVEPGTEFFYIPHVPLGVIEFADFPNRQSDRARYDKSVQERLDDWRRIDEATEQSRITREYSVRDDWDSARLCPVGQSDPKGDYGGFFAWIIIYPMPDSSRLMPMLYMSFEEGMPYMIPLDARNLVIFRDAIWLDETEHMSVFDRIKELLGYRTDTLRPIEDGFRRTAPWLDHNPLFKMKQEHADDLQMLDAFCQKLWEEK
ncbi:MAG: hypothetical protein Q7J42_02055 [Sulfuritalea sp.]|nr:hypothetical protein [Sulfuritalea sp.]